MKKLMLILTAGLFVLGLTSCEQQQKKDEKRPRYQKENSSRS